MSANVNLSSTPLNLISWKAKRLVCLLLNTKKVFLSDGPDKLPRDWRGLASLVNLTSEVATFIDHQSDKTERIFKIWLDNGSPTIEQLLQFLQKMDRYDVYDDLMELHEKGALIDSKPQEYSPSKDVSRWEESRNDLITFDDVKHGTPQLYHAYVLFAREDKDFIDELLIRMKEQGFKLCTEDDLMPGHSTQYGPISRLISERCHRIILVYSPDFLSSPANTFYMDYAQAVGIELKKPKIIPCMYRPCQLPSNLSYYHKLYYTRPGQKATYDFWEKLSQSLEMANLPKLTNGTASSNSVNITEIKTPSNNYFVSSPPTNFLALPPSSSTKSLSYTSIDTLQVTLKTDDSRSLSNLSHTSENIKERKKISKFKKFCNTITGKKKKAVMLEN